MNTLRSSDARPFLHRSNRTTPLLKAAVLVAAAFCCLHGPAPVAAQTTAESAPRVDTQVQSDGVIFTAPGARSLRVRVLLGTREIFDSGPVEGASVEWDGRDEAGRWVADGVYVLQVATSDAAGQITESRESIALRRAPLSSIGTMALTPKPLVGAGTLGRIPRWLGPHTLGDSVLFESAGKIGIGTTLPTSPLTVRGQIHSSLGGFKFPDNSTQITAGLPSVAHDLTLLGRGTTLSPLSIAPNRVSGVHLSANAVTGIKIAPRSVVKSLNGLFDAVTLVPGSNVTITKTGNTLVIAAKVPPSGLASVAHDATLVGNGASAPLGIAPGGVGSAQLAAGAVTADKLAPGVGQVLAGGIGTAQLADGAVTNAKIAPGAVTEDKLAPGVGQVGAGGIGTSQIADGAVTTPKLGDAAVTGAKIAAGQVVRSVNGLTEGVALAPGANVTITPSGNTLTVAAPNALSGVGHDGTLAGAGTAASPLSVAVPLALGGSIQADGPLVRDQVVASTLVPYTYQGYESGIIRGSNTQGNGVAGRSSYVTETWSAGKIGSGVYGEHTQHGPGVLGFGGTGVYGVSRSDYGYGVRGESASGYGVHGSSTSGLGVHGSSASGYGVRGESASGNGVHGSSSSSYGVHGSSAEGYGVYGRSTNGNGVHGSSAARYGVYGISAINHGIYGTTGAAGKSGVYGINTGSGLGYGVYGETTGSGFAGYFSGNVTIPNASSSLSFGSTTRQMLNLYGSGYGIGVQDNTQYFRSANNFAWYRGGTHNNAFFNPGGGTVQMKLDENGDLTVRGGIYKAANYFKIDHPLDPGNKYLSHSVVESPEMMNIYNGNVTTDAKGVAKVTMPNYFSALNRDFRYQLTCIGTFAQAIVANEIKGNQFVIKTDKPNVKVSWQVTGVRQDAYAKAHPIRVTEAKVGSERGAYLHPELFGQPKSKAIGAAPTEAQPQVAQR
jgi:hypothetical protein